MSYEPRGKVKVLTDAMALHPEIALPGAECARIMGVQQSALPAYFDAPIRHQALYPINDRRYYGITPNARPRAPEPVINGQIPRETTATGWKPPQMVPPRGTPTPAPAAASASAPIVIAPATPTPTQAPTQPPRPPEAAPVLPDASIQSEAGATVKEEAPDDQSLTWSIWDDGDVDLFGLVELENGGYRIQAKDVARLRRMLAWLPAC